MRYFLYICKDSKLVIDLLMCLIISLLLICGRMVLLRL